MAEIGLIASVIQVAGAGLKLSQTLYEYADTVANADRRIKDIAKEVQLTSFVIDELGHIFNQDQSSTVLSKNAIKTADETVKECSTVFQELEVALKKTKKNTFGRLMLPFRETKIDLLRNHIDKLKSTLQLLMQVLTHAHQIASQKLDREGEVAQREQIKQLLQNKKKTTKRYEESLRNYTGSDEESDKENEDPKASKDTLMMASSVSSSITTKSLAACVKHIQGLLDDIENLQQALSDEREGRDPSEHHQSLVGSYFRARGHLDSVLLGNPTSGVESDVAGSETTSLRRSELSFSIRRELTGSTLQATESRTSEDVDLRTCSATDQHEWLGMSEKDFDAAFKVAIWKAQEEARREEREKLAETNAKERQDAEDEARRALEATRKAEEALHKAAKDAEKQAQAEVEAKAALDREPIKFEDAMGRKFSFPFSYVSTWPGMRRLIGQAFSTVDLMKPHVDELRYDLVGPSGETILPSLWDVIVQPGWTITMKMRRGFDVKSISKREARQSKHTPSADLYGIPRIALADPVTGPPVTETTIHPSKEEEKASTVAEESSKKAVTPQQSSIESRRISLDFQESIRDSKSDPQFFGYEDQFTPPGPISYKSFSEQRDDDNDDYSFEASIAEGMLQRGFDPNLTYGDSTFLSSKVPDVPTLGPPQSLALPQQVYRKPDRDCSWKDESRQSQSDFVGGFGDNGSVCFSCGDLDHASNECPNGQKCGNCGQIGHNSCHCTSTTAQGSTVAEESKLTGANVEDLSEDISWSEIKKSKKFKNRKGLSLAKAPHNAERSSHKENNESKLQDKTEKKTKGPLLHPAEDNKLATLEKTLLREEETVLNEEEQSILDREKEIREIEKGMAGLNDLLRDMACMTSEQGSQLDSITENVAIVSKDDHPSSVSREEETVLNEEEQLILNREKEIREIEKGVAGLNDLLRGMASITSEQGSQLDSITENVAIVSKDDHPSSVSREEETVLNEEEQSILDREKEIREIEKGMTGLNDLLRGMASITSEQGSQLDSITENVAIISKDDPPSSASREEGNERWGTQNKAGQRKVREIVRERAEMDDATEVRTQDKQDYKLETEEEVDSGLSGLPWGNKGMRHVVVDPGLRALDPSPPRSKTELKRVQMSTDRINEMDDEVDELLKEWTTVLG